MSGNDEAIGSKIKTAIPFVLRWVTQEDTHSGAGCKFVRSGGGEVRITLAPKNMKVVIGGVVAIQCKIRRGETEGLGW